MHSLSIKYPELLFRLFVCLTLFPSGIINAQRTLYVSPTGTNNAAGYYPDWPGASTSIQDAVNLAENGDTVLVTNQASYTPATNIAVFKSITVRSWSPGGLEDPETTVVDCDNSTAGFYINNTGAVVSGFSVINGNGMGGVNNNYGGAVYLSAGVLSNCLVTGNTAVARGGGVYAASANSLVTHCEINNNTVTESADGGGGAYIDSATIGRSTLAGNTAILYGHYRGGGGLFLLNNAVAEGCDIAGNLTTNATGTSYNSFGGGVVMSGNDTRLVDCTISNNSTAGPGLWGGGVAVYNTDIALIQGCTINSNSSGVGGGLVLRWHGDGWGVIITNSIISNNHAFAMGGIYVSLSAQASTGQVFRVYNSVFEDNIILGSATFCHGGAIGRLTYGAWIENTIFRNNIGGRATVSTGVNTGYAPGTTFRNCLFVGNSNAYSSGFTVDLPEGGIMENCTVVSNYSEAVAGVQINDNAEVLNSIVMFNDGDNWNTETANHVFAYSCTYPTNGLVGEGNIQADPLFVGAGNFRLQPSSPCINAGMNDLSWMLDAVDMDGRARIDRFSGVVDMGCYEYIARGTLYQLR